MDVAINKLEEISADERMRELYRTREKSRLDMISKVKYAENRAVERNKAEIAIKLLSIGLPAKQVAEGTGLDIEDIIKLQEQINK